MEVGLKKPYLQWPDDPSNYSQYFLETPIQLWEQKTHGTLLKDGCWSMSLCEFTVGTLLRIWKVKWSSLYFYFPNQILDILYTCRLGLDYHFGFPLPCAATRRIWTHQKRWTCFLRNDKNDASWPHKQQHQWYRRNHCEELLWIFCDYWFVLLFWKKPISNVATLHLLLDERTPLFPWECHVSGHPIHDQHVGAVATPPVTSWLIIV